VQQKIVQPEQQVGSYSWPQCSPCAHCRGAITDEIKQCSLAIMRSNGLVVRSSARSEEFYLYSLYTVDKEDQLEYCRLLIEEKKHYWVLFNRDFAKAFFGEGQYYDPETARPIG
jgi:hypothetical protein